MDDLKAPSPYAELPESVRLEDTVATVDPGPEPPTDNGELREAQWLLKHAI